MTDEQRIEKNAERNPCEKDFLPQNSSKEFLMFPQERQDKLNTVLDLLRSLHGFEDVWQDDFDSMTINVFVLLNYANMRAFWGPLGAVRVAKNAIRKVLRDCKVGMNFLDWPKMQYDYIPAVPGIPAEKIKKGYDKSTIKIEIFV